jgi:hypothetical protein
MKTVIVIVIGNSLEPTSAIFVIKTERRIIARVE